MAEIRIESVTKSFGDKMAVRDTSLTIEDREFLVLLGPSGCGKTTLLRAIAGLGMADSGRIAIDGRYVTYLPPEKRGISMVFQSYAIFPHMTVRENIGFGLRMNKVDDNEIARRVRDAAELLHIEELLDRRPSDMSGGQRQRVAVARALAMEAQVLLMDEPLSNLDALLRLEMRAELKRLLADVNATTVYVTHDQIEALSMGDRVAVMRDGEIQQVDVPGKVYESPSNQFVGSFIGNPRMNFLDGSIHHKGDDVTVAVGGHELIPVAPVRSLIRDPTGDRVVLGIRAENMEILASSQADTVPVTVEVVEPLGARNLLTVDVAGHRLKVSTHLTFAASADQKLHVRFPADQIRWIDPAKRDRHLRVMTDGLDDLDVTPTDRTVEAREILNENDCGGYTVPTAELYPFQWNWDSMFVALGWTELDTGRAWQEIETLFEAQWPSGLVPHIVFWSDASTYFSGPEVWRANGARPATSGISQPPVAATVVRRLAETDRLPSRSLFDAIDRWHRWWHAARDPEQRGVIAISHPWESGRDNLPDWDGPLANVDASNVHAYRRHDLDIVDPAMRPHQADYDRYLALVEFGASRKWDDAGISAASPFWVADPGITAILLRAERDLAWLGASLGVDTSEIDTRIARLEAGFSRLWNPAVGTYCSFDLRTGIRAETGTSASFLAPYAGIDEHTEPLLAALEHWSQACTYLVPSFDPRHPDFEPLRYWRGPVWCMVNYMIATGLTELGATDWAHRIRTSTHDLISLSGMPESFDPVTGAPVGGTRFAWTVAMWLTWARTR